MSDHLIVKKIMDYF